MSVYFKTNAYIHIEKQFNNRLQINGNTHHLSDRLVGHNEMKSKQYIRIERKEQNKYVYFVIRKSTLDNNISLNTSHLINAPKHTFK